MQQCKTCSKQTSLLYNGFPLCSEHYSNCVKTKIFNSLKNVLLNERILLFGTHDNVKIVYNSIVHKFERLTENTYDQFIFYSDQQFDNNFKTITYELELSYFQHLNIIHQLCRDNYISAVIDCQDAQSIASKVIQAVCLGSFHLAIGISKQQIDQFAKEIEINQNFQVKLKYKIQKQEQISKIRLFRPLSAVVEQDVKICLGFMEKGQDFDGILIIQNQKNQQDFQNPEDEIVQSWAQINKIGKEEEKDEIQKCPMCGSAYKTSCMCNMLK